MGIQGRGRHKLALWGKFEYVAGVSLGDNLMEGGKAGVEGEAVKRLSPNVKGRALLIKGTVCPVEGASPEDP